jgi:hypothetical protein
VVASVQEHSPGSFVVQLAGLRTLLEAPPRKKDSPRRAKKREAQWAHGLRPATLVALRELATRSLDMLGAPATDTLVDDEMLHHFTRFASAIGTGVDRDVRLRMAIRTALDELSGA